MKDIILCGHTGSINRGCEAIIKSTYKLLKTEGLNVKLTTHDYENDKKMGISEFDDVFQYEKINMIRKKSFFKYIYIEIQNKLFNNKYPIYKAVQKNIFNELIGNIALNIGGDTYCYNEKPYISYALNKYTNRNNIDCFLWGCSIEENKIDKQMLEDLKRYKMIFPRETITYDTLVKIGIDKKKIFLMSDPAFTLETENVQLPENFNQKSIIGINMSPLVLESGNKDILRKNIYNTIDYIIKKTSYDIALIPHVFNVDTQDVQVNDFIFEKYKDTGRIINIREDFNCKQLKYIISKCEIIIAARTHASIAAYSSKVPTLVLGYSVKSRGIAKDLFGTYDNYVISAQNVKNENELLSAFKWIERNKQSIKNQYDKVLPEYINRSSKASKIIKKYAENIKKES